MSPADGESCRPMAGGEEIPTTRSKWTSGLEAKLSLIASMNSASDYLVLPVVLVSSGGGAVFIPLFLLLVALIGAPMVLLEVGVGQFMDLGTWCSWNIAPLFKGIGYLMTINNAYIIWLFLWMLMAQCLFMHHLVVTAGTSAYNHCANLTVYINGQPADGVTYDAHQNVIFSNGTVLNSTSEEYILSSVHIDGCQPLVDPWGDRWSYNVGGTADVDGVQVLLMLLMILLVCGLTATGKRGIGKISALCVILPYLLMLMLFVRVITLPGAGAALEHGLYPSEQSDYHYQFQYPPATAGRHICMAVLAMFSVGRGTSLTVASYNRFRNNFLLDCLLAVVLKMIMALFIVFTMLGAYGVVSAAVNYPLDRLLVGGIHSLPVVVEALLVHTPSGGFWTACLLTSLLLTSLGAAIWTVEAVVAAITDLLPRTPRFRQLRRRPVLLAVLAVPWFIWGLTYCTTKSYEAILYLDVYCSSPPALLLICLLMCAAVGWTYGARRFQASWAVMQGSCGFPYPTVFWAIVTPIAIAAMLIVSFIDTSSNGLNIIASELSAFLFTLLLVGISGFVLLATRPASSWRQKWRLVTTPWDLAPHQLQLHNRRYDSVAMATMAH